MALLKESKNHSLLTAKYTIVYHSLAWFCNTPPNNHNDKSSQSFTSYDENDKNIIIQREKFIYYSLSYMATMLHVNFIQSWPVGQW